MTTTFSLVPIPKWVIIGNDGLPAGGAKLYTKSQLNPIVNKTVYKDPNGAIPWTNPIIFDANGTQGPFYWSFDSTVVPGPDAYYLEAHDADDNMLWTITNYFPPSGTGGGGGGTTGLSLKNYIINNLFWRNFNNSTVGADVSANTNLVIAPSAHSALPEVSTSTNGATGSDIRFIKSGTGSTDRIRFVDFNLGVNPFAPDVTPAWSLRFTCTVAGGEAYKYLQFPICQNIKNLDGQTMTFVCWAKTETGTASVDVDFRQFHGSGGGSADVFSTSQQLSLTTTWTQFFKTISVPTASGTIGACGDDALYLRMLFPTTTTDLYIAKPQLYLGNLSPTTEFDSYDMIDSVINAPRTGMTQASFISTIPLGWIAADNRSIGDSTSGATNRANTDTFPLYREIYLGCSDFAAPVATGRTAPGNDITSCIADFIAHKAMTLPFQLGRAVLGSNTNFNAPLAFTASGATHQLQVSSSATLTSGTPVLVTGGSLPPELSVNTVYYAIFVDATHIQLAASADKSDPASPDPILVSNGSGTLIPSLGAKLGEGLHTLTIPEMPTHDHHSPTVITGTSQVGGNTSVDKPVLADAGGDTVKIPIAAEGDGHGHNTVQPSVLQNMIIKL